MILLSACISGSGTLITESRDVNGFDQVTLEGSGEVILTQGDTESLTVETDDNLMQYVSTEVRDGTLYLDLRNEQFTHIGPTQLIFRLDVKEIVGLNVLGSGSIEADSLTTDRLSFDIVGVGDVLVDSLQAGELQIHIGGSGNLELAGTATEQDINIGGSGRVLAPDLRSEVVNVRTGGSGDATVWASNTLDARIAGSGKVNYYGSPSVSSSITGSGILISLGDKE